MPSFTYTGEDRYYPTLGLSVTNGDKHDFADGAPADGRWSDSKGNVVSAPVEVAPDSVATPVSPPVSDTTEAQAPSAADKKKE